MLNAIAIPRKKREKETAARTSWTQEF